MTPDPGPLAPARPRSPRRWLGRPWIHAAAWAVVIAVVLFATGPETGALAPWLRSLEAVGVDKVIHWGLFGVQAALVVRALPAGLPVRSVVLAFVLVTAYGALTEAVQLVLPARGAELADLAADGLGALTGALGALLVRRLR